jgi:hypothetical protein
MIVEEKQDSLSLDRLEANTGKMKEAIEIDRSISKFREYFYILPDQHYYLHHLQPCQLTVSSTVSG